MSFINFFSSFGGAIGRALGGGILTTVGRFTGKMLGRYLDNNAANQETYYRSARRQLGLLHLESDASGKPIPVVFGRIRVSSQLIWSKPIREVEQVNKISKLFGASKSDHYQVSYVYRASFAVAICEGEIESVDRVWANDLLIDLSKYQHTLYTGSQNQMPDPLIKSDKGKNTCGFRGIAYIVFNDLPLEDFNNKIPSLSFEVVRKVTTKNSVEKADYVKSLMIIPGSGEFVYDTVVQYRTFSTNQNIKLKTEAINSHNKDNISDSLFNLEQLMQTCPNLKSVGLVVCWFANSLNIRDCKIKPRVEHQDKSLTISEEWYVGNFDRASAPVVGKEGQLLRYGGSVNDASLIRYIKALKERELEVVLYPMFFVDLPSKPWRGHVTGNPEDVGLFFNGDHGYNEFIIHYANLTKGLVDGFIIGSELSKITTIKTDDNKFPAVDELINLTQITRSILGDKVKISYAADWTEYACTKEGWYHLDPLWSNPNINFIGIDLYLPLTLQISSIILPEDIDNGWNSCEGHDYYVDKGGCQIKLDANTAWKNIVKWWTSTHVNPDGSETSWVPKMKKICFTEFGYPSIDKATNQPNVFFDPRCIDGNIPYYSTGNTDFSIQRNAIKEALKNWQNNEMLTNMYLWAWDARPYPAWPHYNVWTDSYLWEKGHWINGKLDANLLSSVIVDICKKSGIIEDKIKTLNLDILVPGVIFDQNISCLDAINLLRCAYFFDLYQQEDKIVFKKRCAKIARTINLQDVVAHDNKTQFILDEVTEQQTLNQIHLSFINQNKKYDIDKVYVNPYNSTNHGVHFLHLPLILSDSEAFQLAVNIINNAKIENKTISFYLPVTYLELNPCDIINFNALSFNYLLRIVSIKLEGLLLKITAIPEDIKIYQLDYNLCNSSYANEEIEPFIFLDLPYLPQQCKEIDCLRIAYRLPEKINLYASLDDKNFEKIGVLSNINHIGKVLSFINLQDVSNAYVDYQSSFDIYIESQLDEYIKENSSQITNLALIGREIIGFQEIQNIESNTYRISKLIRGVMATDEFINNHYNQEPFVLITNNLTSIEVNQELLDKLIHFKIGTYKKTIHKISSKRPPKPSKIKWRFDDDSLYLEWLGRDMQIDDIFKIQEKVLYHLSIRDNLGNFQEYQTIDNKLEIDSLNFSEVLTITIITEVNSIKGVAAELSITK